MKVPLRGSIKAFVRGGGGPLQGSRRVASEHEGYRERNARGFMSNSNVGP